MIALAAALAAAAVAVLVPTWGTTVAAPRRARTLRRRTLAVGAAAGAGVVAAGSGLLVVLALVVGGAVFGGARLVRARAVRQRSAATSARVLESCEALAAELVAGRPPGAALDVVAAEWPALGPVAEAHRVGADVPAAWRAVAAEPGARDLEVVAAAWLVSHRTGEGLAGTLAHVARELRAGRATQRVVEGELASARATARLVALLPVLALCMGSGAGGDPWGFLLTTPVGLGCLAAGLALALAGLGWIEGLARGVVRW